MNSSFHPDDANLHIYVAMPTGFGERTTMVIASSPQDAHGKALSFDNIKEAVNLFGAQLQILNATELFQNQGWDIFVARKGNFH